MELLSRQREPGTLVLIGISELGYTYWVLSLQDRVLGDCEDEGTKDTGNSWRNRPGSKNLRDTLPSPVDAIFTKSSNTSTDDLFVFS